MRSAPTPVLSSTPVTAGIYNPADGDPDSGIPPGTSFADIPDDWYCPVCGSTKSSFIPLG